MSTPAVTPDASAAPVSESPKQSEHSTFLPTDKHYRMTGERPEAALPTSEEEKLETTSAETEGASAASDSDTAAASEAATTQDKLEKGPAETKSSQTSETRWQKITRENRELREKLARAEGADSARRETQQASQPATEVKAGARPEPKIDDVDAKTGKAKYTTWDDFQKDQRAWDREEAIRSFQESTSKTAKEREQQQQLAAIGKSLAEKFAPVRAKYPDFDAVALNPDLLMPMNSVTDVFMQDSEHAGEVAYYLGQHPDILQGFYGDFDKKTGKFTNKITPQRQFRKLMEIEAKVTGDKSSSEKPTLVPAKPVTQAPRPPNQVSGKGTVAKDAVEQALADGDQDTYRREMNARDPRFKAAVAARQKGR